MPQEFRKYEDPSLDGRFKLLPSKYPEVRRLYGELKSSRKVAALFGVDKKTILFIVNPDTKAKDEKRRIDEKVWLRYYNRIEHRQVMRDFRAKKRELGHAIYKSRTNTNKPELCVYGTCNEGDGKQDPPPEKKPQRQ